MIRVLLGSALPIVGLGIAAAFMGPDLLTGPRGEPMLILAAADQPTLSQARFDGEACASKLLFADRPDAGRPDALAGTRIIAFALRAGTHDVEVELEDFPDGAARARTVVLVFDEAGRLVAAGDPTSLHLTPAAAAQVGGCLETSEHERPGPI